MSDLQRQVAALEREAVAQLAVRRAASLSAADRTLRVTHRLVAGISSVAAMVAVWDLGLLLRVHP